MVRTSDTGFAANVVQADLTEADEESAPYRTEEDKGSLSCSDALRVAYPLTTLKRIGRLSVAHWRARLVYRVIVAQ